MKKDSKLRSLRKSFDPNPQDNIKSSRLESGATVQVLSLLQQTERTHRMRNSFACRAVKTHLTTTFTRYSYSYMVINVFTMPFTDDINMVSPRPQSGLFVELLLKCLEVVGNWGPLY